MEDSLPRDSRLGHTVDPSQTSQQVSACAPGQEDHHTHVAFVLPSGEYYSKDWSGAIATITRHLAGELTRLGHQVTVLTPDDGSPLHHEGTPQRLSYGAGHPVSLVARVLQAGVAKARRHGSADQDRYIRAVLRGLRRTSVPPGAVVVANDPQTAGRLARRLPGAQIVLWLHNRLEGEEARPFAVLPSEVKVVAVSQAVAVWTRERYLPHADIRVIYSGVDLDLFSPRPDWLEPRDPVRVVCHGRIDPNKGHETAAEAVRRLREQGHPVEFTLIGQVRTFGFSRAAEQSYEREVVAAVEGANGTLKGWLPHTALAEELRTHDIECVLSRVDEPFGLVNLEAMASGCAVVATRKGGIPEAVGNAAALVDADSPEQVADVLGQWILNRDSLSAAKSASRVQAEKFRWSQTADDLVDLLSAHESGARN